MLPEVEAPWRESFEFKGVAYTIEVPPVLVVGSVLYGCRGNEFLAKVHLVMPRLRRGDALVFPVTKQVTPDDLALIQAAWRAVEPFTKPSEFDFSTLPGAK
jgi:hypothetical protein